MKSPGLLLVLLIVAGCSSPSAPDATTEATPPRSATPASEAPEVVSAPIPIPATKPAADLEETVVEVNGEKITRGAVQKEVDAFVEQYKAVPPEVVAQALPRIRKNFTEQIVARMLVDQEIARSKVEPTKADENRVLDEMKSMLPPGETIESMLKGNSEMKKRLSEHVSKTAKLDKLMEKEMKITEEERAEFINANGMALVLPETVQASHILIAFGRDDNEVSKKEKKDKLDQIRKQIVAGADFADMAKKHSDCPSKDNGGDIGVFPRDGKDAPEKPFADAAFTQKVGDLGPVIETRFGYHIIKATAHNPGGRMTGEQITFVLKDQKRKNAMGTLVERLLASATIKYLDKAFEPEPEAMPGMMPPSMPRPQ